ncbi:MULTISPECIES: GNAT family N-acetyltransferase [Mycolicibacterium]|jgi:GNAT superfamily N-acetyltransferase|uniref:GNAT family N-acetyltransferase n=2 Tax=Mycolicibacterium TaxID=1866885 RepID=UPI00056C0C1C|nr:MULTISPECIES: GNAT family N-acetyltransferase [Mycolicibacterium]MDW5613657.1 GNAT family N-acetyltransferase [Mycolicibacterium sp. D5.8-2]QZY48314.1 GNAT family N-acetyltransferase [Mycolicibacterium austroafricanum]UJL26823.1 GNAT family N-acetyltransferase [Mycolicibacterium vanbaalenii]WND58944.1 GNAT family N-acetyltransferase [Mycolicibacterium vanbaalenii]
MTDPDATAASREMATAASREMAAALVHALERRHEVLDAVVASDDYDAAIDSLADLLDTSAEAAEAVLRLSFDRLTKVSRRRIAAELEDLNSRAQNYTPPEQTPGSARRLLLRPFAADQDRDIFAARTEDMRSAGDGTAAPAGDLGDEIAAAVARVAAEEAAWLVAEVGSAKVGMVFGDLADGEVGVRIWIHPSHRKQGYGTAALRASRSEMAAYFPAVPLVVRAPAAGA